MFQSFQRRILLISFLFDIQLIAEKIIEIEKKTKEEKGTLDKTNSSYIAEIEELIRNLSMTDLFRIDDYIMSRKLLTK